MENSMINTAQLTYEAEKNEQIEVTEPIYFHLKEGQHEFKIGLLDILSCIEYAEKEGLLPGIPLEWWRLVKNHYSIPFEEEEV